MLRETTPMRVVHGEEYPASQGCVHHNMPPCIVEGSILQGIVNVVDANPHLQGHVASMQRRHAGAYRSIYKSSPSFVPTRLMRPIRYHGTASPAERLAEDDKNGWLEGSHACMMGRFRVMLAYLLPSRIVCRHTIVTELRCLNMTRSVMHLE